ncbi:hypothetical protein [Enterobacter sp. Bisph1]|uniref:hypothetical protein n=1 Tax=Enterobacter sp. Bisph1 TaxID=1274399 RepID=UPI00057BFD61|nr:hypothetical protein [Enterobacter sp. Bisph1]
MERNDSAMLRADSICSSDSSQEAVGEIKSSPGPNAPYRSDKLPTLTDAENSAICDVADTVYKWVRLNREKIATSMGYGGWEGWLQIELCHLFRSKKPYEFDREQRYSDNSLKRMDFMLYLNNIILAVEIKTESNKSSVADFIRNISEDFIKFDKNEITVRHDFIGWKLIKMAIVIGSRQTYYALKNKYPSRKNKRYRTKFNFIQKEKLGRNYCFERFLKVNAEGDDIPLYWDPNFCYGVFIIDIADIQ